MIRHGRKRKQCKYREGDMATFKNSGSDNCLLSSQQNEDERGTLDIKQQMLEKWEEIKFVEKGSRVKLPNINKDRKSKKLIKIKLLKR